MRGIASTRNKSLTSFGETPRLESFFVNTKLLFNPISVLRLWWWNISKVRLRMIRLG